MTYAIGNKVWLLRKNLTTIRLCKKLDCKFQGPFQVLDVIGKNAYQLKLPLWLKIHLVFHILLLEPANKTQNNIGKPLPPFEVNGKEEYYVKNVFDSKYQWAMFYYLVKWEGYSKKKSSGQPGRDLENTQKVDKFYGQYTDKPGLELNCPATKQPSKRQ